MPLQLSLVYPVVLLYRDLGRVEALREVARFFRFEGGGIRIETEVARADFERWIAADIAAIEKDSKEIATVIETHVNGLLDSITNLCIEPACPDIGLGASAPVEFSTVGGMATCAGTEGFLGFVSRGDADPGSRASKAAGTRREDGAASRERPGESPSGSRAARGGFSVHVPGCC